MNNLASECVGIVGVIDPDAYAAGTVTTGWIKAGDFQRFMATVSAGDLGTNGTLDAKLEQASDSTGTGAKDVTGKAITQLTQAGGDSNKQAIINLNPDELDIANGFGYFRLSLTVGTATSDAGAMVQGVYPRTGGAEDNDATTVAEIVQ